MDIHHLVAMINDISDFFEHQGSKTEAAAGVESHVARYWEQRMRVQMLAHYRAGGDGLSVVSLAAVKLLAREGSDAPRIHALDGGIGGDAG
jgi:formate dehydrogenase subunit delta